MLTSAILKVKTLCRNSASWFVITYFAVSIYSLSLPPKIHHMMTFWVPTKDVLGMNNGVAVVTKNLPRDISLTERCLQGHSRSLLGLKFHQLPAVQVIA